MKRRLILLMLVTMTGAITWSSAEACGRRRGACVYAHILIPVCPLPLREAAKKPTFAIHGYEGIDPAREFGPLQAEIEKRGFRCLIIRSPKTTTPNQDRAKVMVEASKDVEGDVVLAGISNQGLYMPLVAAARPVRRIVMINAVIPQPGKSFAQAFDLGVTG